MEPVFRRYPDVTAASTPTTPSAVENDPPRGNPSRSRRLHATLSSGGMPEAAAGVRDPSTEEGVVSPPQHGFADLDDGGSSHHYQRPAEADGSSTNHLVHVAYRHSNLKSVHSRQQHKRQQQAPSGSFAGTDSIMAKVMNVGEGDSRYKDSDVSRSQKAEQQENGEKEKRESQVNSKREQHYLAGDEYPRRSLSESKTSPLPFVVENGARGPGPRDTDPLVQHPACPSSPRVFQVGIAMDTGYFKVSRPGYSQTMIENICASSPVVALTFENCIISSGFKYDSSR